MSKTNPDDLADRTRALQRELYEAQLSTLETIRWQAQADAYPKEVDEETLVELRRSLLGAITYVEEALNQSHAFVADALAGRIVEAAPLQLRLDNLDNVVDNLDNIVGGLEVIAEGLDDSLTGRRDEKDEDNA